MQVLSNELKLLYYRRCLLALLSFVWFALFAASVAVVAFGPSVFSFVFPYVVHVFFSLFPPVHVLGGRRKGLCSFPLLSLVFHLLSLLYCAFSL